MKVSIIIPTYNRPALCEKTLLSCMSQLYVNKEIILVNDGSSKNYDQIKAFCKRHWIHYVEKENQGCPSAINTGIRSSNGEAIVIMADDDLFYDEHSLSIRMELLRQGFAVAWTSAVNIDAEGHIIGDHIAQPPNLKRIIEEDYIYMNSMIWRRDIIPIIGMFEEDMIFNEDWEFKLKCIKSCKCTFSLDKTLRYRRHEGGKSILYPQRVRDYEIIFRRRLIQKLQEDGTWKK